MRTKNRGKLLYSVIKPYLIKNENFLDVCCGYAPLAELLIKAGHSITGFDNSAEAISALKTKFPSGNWLKTSHENTNFSGFTTLLLLGIDIQYNDDAFKAFLEKTLKNNRFHLVLTETKRSNEKRPWMTAFRYVENLLARENFTKITSGSYALNKKISRIYELWCRKS